MSRKLTAFDIFRPIGKHSNCYVSGPGDQGSIPGQVIPKIKKWYLLNNQYYKVWIKGK